MHYRRVMVLNDAAHHVWDSGSAWNEAIRALHETILARSGCKLVAQLDFSATPKDNNRCTEIYFMIRGLVQ
jgi:type III restriction enzyme